MEPWMWEVVFGFMGVIVFIVSFCMIVLPRYNVWAAHQAGLADLARAQNEQQIQIAMATSRLAAADLNKKAEIIGAEAVSKSMEIIGEALKQNEGYLQWQWIRMMEQRHAKSDTIYVATEAGLPILKPGQTTGKR